MVLVGLDVALVAQTPEEEGHSWALAGVQPAASGTLPVGPPPGKTVPGEPGCGMPIMIEPAPPVPVFPGPIGFGIPMAFIPPAPSAPAAPRSSRGLHAARAHGAGLVRRRRSFAAPTGDRDQGKQR